MKTFPVEGEQSFRNTQKIYRKTPRISRKYKYRRSIHRKTRNVRHYTRGRKIKTSRRKRRHGHKGGETFLDKVKGVVEGVKSAAVGVASSAPVGVVKSAVKVTALGLLDTSNVKGLHFKNHFFIDYMDIATIRDLYGDDKILIRYNTPGLDPKNLNFEIEMIHTDKLDRLGQNGYLISPGTSTESTTNNPKDTISYDPFGVKEIHDFWQIRILEKDAISFDRLNNAEMIDPRFYSKIKSNMTTAKEDLKYFLTHCIAFKKDELHCAMYELVYSWRYLLHTMLWDANDKTKHLVRFLYSAFTRKIMQNKAYANQLKDSIMFIQILKIFREFFRRNFSNTKPQENASETVPHNIAEQKIAEEEFQEIVNDTAPDIDDTITPSEDDLYDVSDSDEESLYDVSDSDEESLYDVDVSDVVSDDPKLKGGSNYSPVLDTDIITQLRGFFNIPFNVLNGMDSNEAFIKYANDNKKYTELPPFYTVVDVKYALHTVDSFLQKILDTTDMEILGKEVIYFQNSKLTVAYNYITKSTNHAKKKTGEKMSKVVKNVTSTLSNFLNVRQKKTDPTTENANPTTENASPTTENASPTTENANPTTETKVYGPKIAKYMEYPTAPTRTLKYTFFQNFFNNDADYRKSSESFQPKTIQELIKSILTKQDQINEKIDKFIADKANYKDYLEDAAIFSGVGVSQRIIDYIVYFLFETSIDTEFITNGGGGVTDRLSKGWTDFKERSTKARDSFYLIKKRFGNYTAKKKSILREKYFKIMSLYKTNPFLDLVKCALFQSATNTYRRYIIDPMFKDNVVANQQQILPLKLYKTLGLFSLRMVQVVCQSPLNRTISRFTPTYGLVKTPHCYQLGFLTSMIRSQWYIISPPPDEESKETSSPLPQKPPIQSSNIPPPSMKPSNITQPRFNEVKSDEPPLPPTQQSPALFPPAPPN
jgi:hypothetical protein